MSMGLQWLGKYEDFVSKLMHFGNAYVQNYNTERSFDVGAEFSASEIQTMEYILVNSHKHQNMAEVASHLGIPTSTFSKNVKKMMKKGLLEKYHFSTNKKDIIIRVSAFGQQVYDEYSRYAYENLYKEVFAILDEVPEEYVARFTKILDLCASTNSKTAEPVLVKVSEEE